MVFNTGPYTVLPDNFILITANMQSETGFPSSHQLKSYVAFVSDIALFVLKREVKLQLTNSYVASKSRLKLAARTVLSVDAGLLVLYNIMASLIFELD